MAPITAPVAAVDVIGAAAERGVRDTEPPLPDPDPDPPPPLLRGDPFSIQVLTKTL